MTSRRDQAWLADLAVTLTEVDEFLRSPAGYAALRAWYQARGNPAGSGAGLLIDSVSFAVLGLRQQAGHQQHS
jgi:hypothetical protein